MDVLRKHIAAIHMPKQIYRMHGEESYNQKTESIEAYYLFTYLLEMIRIKYDIFISTVMFSFISFMDRTN